MSRESDRLDGRFAGGKERQYLLPVSEGEWGHVVRLIESLPALAASIEALDILRGMWEARVSAEGVSSESPRVDQSQGSEDPLPWELGGTRASRGRQSREELEP